MVSETEQIRLAAATVRAVVRRNQENFSVLSVFVPRALLADFSAVYAFCRIADDASDEVGIGAAAHGQSLLLLGMMRACLPLSAGQWLAGGRPATIMPLPPLWPDLFLSLARTRERHSIGPAPFEALLGAFEQDQSKQIYATWAELLEYSRGSANPVGELVLNLFGFKAGANKELFEASNCICTALQLTNFWQDVRRDLTDRGRVYLPLQELGFSPADLRCWIQGPPRAEFGDAVLGLCKRTAEMFREGGQIFGMLSRTGGQGHRASRVIQLFDAGGRGVLNRIVAIKGMTLWERPRLTRLNKFGLMLKALCGARRDRPL